MTNEDIASLQAMDAAAKRPPWTVEGAYVFPGDPDEVEGEAVWIFGTDDCGHPPTAALIVAARNALPRLLDEREALLEALKNIQWAGVAGEASHFQTAGCPECEAEGEEERKHRPGCKVAAAIAKAESP